MRRQNRPLVAVRGRGTVTEPGDTIPDRYQETPDEIVEMLDRALYRDRLNQKSITELRKMSKGGVVEGGYSMKKAELVEALLDAGVTG